MPAIWVEFHKVDWHSVRTHWFGGWHYEHSRLRYRPQSTSIKAFWELEPSHQAYAGGARTRLEVRVDENTRWDLVTETIDEVVMILDESEESG